MGWLSGFNYRKSHIIQNAAGAGTLYQKRIKVHYGSGTDSGEDVYLNSHGRTDFGDVRFCYSPDTEVLTENGFITLKELVEQRVRVKIASLNPKINKLEFHYPTKYFKIRYTGSLLHEKGRAIDLLVTPEHRMYARKAWDARKGRGFSFIEAQTLPKYVEYKRDADWDGKEKIWFKLPIVQRKSNLGNPSILKNISKIKMDDWLRFFGVWLAEGSAFIDQDKCKVHISQWAGDKKKTILYWSRKCGFEAKEKPDGLLIWSKQLYAYLKQFGHAESKFIPIELKQLSKRQLKILFNAMMLGDGHWRGENSWIYGTISKRLADDVQEIALKLRLVTTIQKRAEGTIAFGKYRRKSSYILSITDGSKTPALRGIDRSWVKYDGYVYDIKLPPHHLLYVRRNGKSCWSSNCDNDGSTLLDYWMESKVDGDYAVFWVEVADDLSSQNQTIYVYYGAPTQTTTSNGDNTFPFFDDFPGSSLNTDKWSGDVAAAVVADSIVTLTASSGDVILQQNSANYPYLAYPKALRTKAYLQSIAYSGVGMREVSAGNDFTFFFSHEVPTRTRIMQVRNGVSTVADSNWTVNAYRTFEIFWLSSQCAYYDNGVQVLGSPIATNVPLDNLGAWLYAGGASGYYVKADWILIRKYVSPEPSHGTWGSEETGAVLKEVMDSLSLSDVLLCNKTFAVTDSVGLADAPLKHWTPQISDSIALSDSILRNKTFQILDSLGLSDTILRGKQFSVSDSISLCELITVIMEIIKQVTDSLSLSEAVSLNKALVLADQIQLTDNVYVNKILTVSDGMALVDVVEKSVQGVVKTRIFLIMGDLAIQLTGD